MQRFKQLTLLVACLALTSMSASAQFSNSTDQSGKGRGRVTTATKNNVKSYSRVELSYNPMSINYDWDGGEDNVDMTGFSVGYIKGFSISKQHPLYVEVGAQLHYAFWSDDKTLYMDGFEDLGGDELFGYDCDISDVHDKKDIEDKTTYLGISIPVNIAYRFAIPNSELTVTPFVGLTLKGNIIAKSKTSVTYDITYWDTDKTVTETTEAERDFFDKDDVGKDGKWSRFQIGWNIGAGVNFKDYYAGIKYGSDLGEVAEDTKTSNWAITVGYCF